MQKNADLKYLIIITIIYCLLAVFMWKYTGNSMFIDIGREAYIPAQMLKGAALYKDILNIYGSLGYQINALLYAVFGINYTVLLVAGLVNGFIFTVTVYLITKTFNTKPVSLALTITVMCLYVFYFNAFVTPYTYAIAYATTAIYLALLFTLLYVRKKAIRLFYLACLFAGASFILKYDFIGYIVVLLLVLVRDKRFKLPEVSLSILSLMFVPTISLIALFSSSVNLEDISKNVDFMRALSATEALKLFYLRFSSFYPNLTLLLVDITSFILITLLIGCLVLIVHFVLNYLKLIKNLKTYKPVNVITYVLLLLYAPAFLYIYFGIPTFFFRIYTWLPLAGVFILGAFVYLNKHKLNTDDHFSQLIILLAAITFTLKGLFYCSIIPYGIFLLPLATIVFYSYSIRVIKRLAPNLKNSSLLISSALVIFSSITFIEMAISVKKYLPELINTNYGSLHIGIEEKKSFTELINYIEANTLINEKVLIIPEGQMINFLTNRASDDVLATIFFPPFIEAYGEDKILQRLKAENIPTIVLLKRSMQEYLPRNTGKEPYFGKAFAVNSYDYIKTNYNLVKSIGQNDFILVYKLK